MKTKIKYLMLTLVAVFACVSISSCSKDDDDPNQGIGNYYFQLYTVESNCIDANGNNIADALKSEWISAKSDCWHWSPEVSFQVGQDGCGVPEESAG